MKRGSIVLLAFLLMAPAIAGGAEMADSAPLTIQSAVLLLDSKGKASFAEGIGPIVWKATGKNIVVKVSNSKRSITDAFFRDAIIDVAAHEGNLYYILDRSLVELRDADDSGAGIEINLKKAKFGEVLSTLSRKQSFNYSIKTNTDQSSGALQQAAMPVAPLMNNQGQGFGSIYDITLDFSYSGNSIDAAIELLCTTADVYCKKENDVYVIDKYETYIVDKDIFFTYSLSSGGMSAPSVSAGNSGVASAAGSITGSVATTGQSSYQGQISSASMSSGSSGTSDSVAFSGTFDDFTKLLKPFLSPKGVIQLSHGGYIVITDVPSAIRKVRKIVSKDIERDRKVRLHVSVIRVDLNNNYSAGVNWDAAIKDFAIKGKFAPAGGFSFAYNTPAGSKSPVSGLVSVLGTYGSTKVVKTWEAYIRNGVPVFFNVVQDVPYFTNTQIITNGVAQQGTNVNYVSVGLKIKVLPNINEDVFSGGIYAEVSELTGFDFAGDNSKAPLITATNTALPLFLKMGESFVLTGFKVNEHDFSTNGIPLLSKIPVVGALFGYQEKKTAGSELAIVITPKRDDPQATDKEMPGNDMPVDHNE